MKSFQYSFFSGGRLLIIPIQSISQHPFRSRNAGHGASEGCIHLHTQLSFISQHFVIAPPSFFSHIKFSDRAGFSITVHCIISVALMDVLFICKRNSISIFKEFTFFLSCTCESLSTTETKRYQKKQAHIFQIFWCVLLSRTWSGHRIL